MTAGPDQDRPVALITGAARRIGRATARAFARAGCDIVITYRTSAVEAADAKAELESLGARVRLERLDLADLDATIAAGARLAGDLDRLDYLIHNASIYRATALDELTADEILTHYTVNAAGPLLLTAQLAPLLRASRAPGGGAVVCMCDIHAMGRPRTGFAAYAMSKAALAEMVRSLARDLAPDVRVTGVAPGVVAWPESGYESDREAQQAYLSRVPLGRSGTPDDAAATIRWLAMEATYVTGVVLPLDGGRRLA
ncbi:MAG: SDR family oxidoreductase [Phycisphaerales bacterium JB039]